MRVRTTFRRGRLGRRSSLFVIGAFLVLWFYALFFVIRPWATTVRRVQMVQSAAAGYVLLAELGTPPSADPLSKPVLTTRTRRGFSLDLSQEFTMPGYFADTVAWYREKMERDGWQPYDQDDWTDFYTEFCRSPWMLELSRGASYEDLSDPLHHFNLRLHWAPGITPGHCSSPGF